jgi:hypothetical protein
MAEVDERGARLTRTLRATAQGWADVETVGGGHGLVQQDDDGSFIVDVVSSWHPHTHERYKVTIEKKD